LHSIPKSIQLTGFQLVEDPKTTVMAQFAHHPLASPLSRDAGPKTRTTWPRPVAFLCTCQIDGYGLRESQIKWIAALKLWCLPIP